LTDPPHQLPVHSPTSPGRFLSDHRLKYRGDILPSCLATGALPAALTQVPHAWQASVSQAVLIIHNSTRYKSMTCESRPRRYPDTTRGFKSFCG